MNMKPSGNSKSGGSNLSSSKSKKSKDRDKKKNNVEKIEDKGSPTKECSYGQYAGIGKDSIRVYSGQVQGEILTDEVCTGLAEDITYKLRQVINDALIKARLSGRNFISSSDLEETFENFNVDKAYGATNTPNWVYLNEHNIYYLDDPCENLIEIAESEVSFVQCSRLNLKTEWVGSTKEVSPRLKKYFGLICKAIASNDDNLKMTALKDLQTNHCIGPIVEWFYNFSYFLLSKNVTYDCLTSKALDLLVALEENPIAMQSVSEKMLKLLTRLLLQRILRSATTLELLKSICYVIYLFCGRIPLREYVLSKVQEKVVDIKNSFPLSMVVLLNTLGKEAIMEVLIPHIDYFMCLIKMNNQNELRYSLLATFSIIQDEKISVKFKDFEHALVPFYKIPSNIPKLENQEMNWVKVKIQLFKSRRELIYERIKNERVENLHKVFSDYQSVKQEINVVFHTIEAKNRRVKIKYEDLTNQGFSQDKNSKIIIGKYSPFSYKHGYFFPNDKKCCYDHSLFSYC